MRTYLQKNLHIDVTETFTHELNNTNSDMYNTFLRINVTVTLEDALK